MVFSSGMLCESYDCHTEPVIGSLQTYIAPLVSRCISLQKEASFTTKNLFSDTGFNCCSLRVEDFNFDGIYRIGQCRF